MLGQVSPKVHVCFDNLFKTVEDITSTYDWKLKCHFKESKEMRGMSNKPKIYI
jgi:hypothetical protein